MITFKEHIVEAIDPTKKIESINNKIQSHRDAIGMAKEKRKAKGQHVQSMREIQLQRKIDDLSNERDALSKLKEENTQGDEGTPKLTKHRKALTPGEKPVTPEPLKNFETYK